MTIVISLICGIIWYMSVINPITSRLPQSGLESVIPELSRILSDQSSATSAHLSLPMVSLDTLVYIHSPVDGIQDGIHGQRTDVLSANVLSAYRLGQTSNV